MTDAHTDGDVFGIDDPRLTADDVRVLEADGRRERIVLAGVVHDHPASVYRAEQIVRAVGPDVLALELPALAVALFEQFATSSPAPHDDGGEMSAAIQGANAAGTERIVGVDMPSTAYLRALAGTVRTRSLATLRGIASETWSVTCHAVRCRLAAAGALFRDETSPVDGLEHDCRHDAPPAVQAANETAHLSRSRSLLGAVQRPQAMVLTDEARERAMARRIDALGRTGSTVGILGFGHLDSVADQLVET